MADQKVGRDQPIIATTLVIWSMALLRCTADLTPRYIPKRIVAHPNIKFLGKISKDELVHNYSNALATFFPFTHEPFGYIPVESMACGTPVLSYNRQGPGESIRHGNTGWLTDNEKDLVDITVKIWKEGYDPQMRRACRTASLAFDTTLYVKQWLKQLEIYLKS